MPNLPWIRAADEKNLPSSISAAGEEEKQRQRGTGGAKPDAVARGTESKEKKEASQSEQIDKWVGPSGKKVVGTTPPHKGADYATAAIALARQLAEATYNDQTHVVQGGGQPAPWKERRTDFLDDDSECDCTKFVLKAMLNAENAAYAGRNWYDIQVRGFGDASIGSPDDLSIVGGMLKTVRKLVSLGKVSGIKTTGPQRGDIMFWGGHVAIVSELKSSESPLRIDFRGFGGKLPKKGEKGKKGVQIYNNKTVSEIEQNADSSSPWGAGKWVGFWTPYFPP